MPPRALTSQPSFALAWHWLEGRGAPCASREALWAQVTPSLRARSRPGAAGLRPGPLPLHPERLDPSWFWTTAEGSAPRLDAGVRAALGVLPPPIRRAVCRLAGLSEDAHLAPPGPLGEAAARSLFAHLVDMEPERAPDPHGADASLTAEALAASLPSLPAETVQAAVTQAGVPTLGALLRHLPDRAAAGLCGRFPEPLKTALWVRRQRPEAGEGSAPPSRDALARLHMELDQPDPARLLFALGAQRLGAFLAHHGPHALRQVAQLLPVPAGRLLLFAPAGAEPPPVESVRQALRAQ